MVKAAALVSPSKDDHVAANAFFADQKKKERLGREDMKQKMLDEFYADGGLPSSLPF